MNDPIDPIPNRATEMISLDLIDQDHIKNIVAPRMINDDDARVLRTLAGGTSFIYAFTDGLMAGPVQTAVVRERDLRP